MKILLLSILALAMFGFMISSVIAAGGDITAVKTQSEGNNLEHDTAWGQHNSLVQVDSDTYALAYGGLGDSEDISHGWISTFTISSDFKK